MGAAYTVFFEQTVTNSLLGGVAPSARWKVTFGGVSQVPAPVPLPAFGVPAAWQAEMLVFTANAPKETLRFTVESPTPFSRNDVGLDSVRVQEKCGASLAGTQVVRAGMPPNPVALAPANPPTIGFPWDPVVDHSTFVPNALADVYLVCAFPENLPIPGAGTLLCSGILLSEVRLPGEPLHLIIPGGCNLIDVRLCVQAASVDPSLTVTLTNALDVVIGN